MHARDTWIDYAKAIGIILVVYGHVARGLYNADLPLDAERFTLTDSIIYSFHMPLFFFLSGLLFHESLSKHGTGGLIVGKLDSIVYPYVLWSLLQGSCEVLLSNYTNGNLSFAEVLTFAWHPRAQFWFLYTLFFIFLLSALVYARARREHFLPLLLLFAALYLLPELRSRHFLADFLLANTVFFALGIWFDEIKAFFVAHARALLPLCAALFIGGQYLFHIPLGLNYRDYGLATLALATVSIGLVVALSLCLAQLRLNWLLLIGASSMAIYLMHILAGSGTRILLSKVLGIDSLPVHLVLGTLVGIGGPLLAQALINRHRLNFLLRVPRALSAQWLLTLRPGPPKAPL